MDCIISRHQAQKLAKAIKNVVKERYKDALSVRFYIGNNQFAIPLPGILGIHFEGEPIILKRDPVFEINFVYGQFSSYCLGINCQIGGEEIFKYITAPIKDLDQKQAIQERAKEEILKAFQDI
jgi:hypothetical protein